MELEVGRLSTTMFLKINKKRARVSFGQHNMKLSMTTLFYWAVDVSRGQLSASDVWRRHPAKISLPLGKKVTTLESNNWQFWLILSTQLDAFFYQRRMDAIRHFLVSRGRTLRCGQSVCRTNTSVSAPPPSLSSACPR